MFRPQRKVRWTWVWGWVLLAAVGAVFAILGKGAGATGPYSPQVNVSLWDPNPSAPSSIVITTWVTSDPTMGTWSVYLPLGWGVTNGGGVPIGDVVAEATMSVDVDCNGTIENYGSLLLANEPIDPTAVADWTGYITPWWVLTISVDGSDVQGYDLSADLTTITQPHTFCGPQVLAVTMFGRSSPGGVQLLTNPATAGSYTFTVLSVSRGGAYAAQPTDVVTIASTPLPTTDVDGDGVIDEFPCGSDPNNAASRPERLDGPFAGTDDNGNGLTDEMLPPGAEGFDCDGDGFKGSAESGRPLCGNGLNDDGVIFGGADDGVVDDGCPGGPAQAGAYSEAQFNIGLGDQNPCGNNGWPAELAGGDNRVTLADITSFVVPAPKKLGTSPGAPGFNARWNLVPGGGGAAWIVLSDITSLTAGPSSRPPMLGGVRAFGGPVCPWGTAPSPTPTPGPSPTPSPTPTPTPTPTLTPTPTPTPSPLPNGDTDGDGVIDETACGSDPNNAASRPERVDGAFAGVDDDGDTLVDEALPAGAANFDCDGDGFRGSAESGTPLCGNSLNDDGHVFGGADDGVVDDGCPGGPAQAGAYSEAQFRIGLGDQDACGNNGWPAELAGGDNKVTLADITSFVVPAPRKFNTSPGDPAFNPRWDLVPGSASGVWIALSDITSLTTGPTSRPPMLGGVRAFGGPVCPWPP